MAEMTLRQALSEIDIATSLATALGVLPTEEKEWNQYRQALEVAVGHRSRLPGCYPVLPVPAEDFKRHVWDKIRDSSEVDHKGHRIIHSESCRCHR